MSFQTRALHCMLISHGLLYMVMSKGFHVTDVDVFFTHVTGLCVACIGLVVGSTGVMGANATKHLSEDPVRLHYTCPIYYTTHCTEIQSVFHWEVYMDSSISADSGHERWGAQKSHVPVNGNLSYWQCLLSYMLVPTY